MCGASSEQKQTYQSQSTLMNQLMQQAQSIFGSVSGVFGDLVGSLAPIVAAGPDQKGYSLPLEATLKSQAITQTGQAYKNASQAVKQANAASGGGNIVAPSGAEIGANLSVANAGAAQTANELQNIDISNYQTGRQNYFQAVNDLQQAPNVFAPATSAGSAATGAGEATSQTANEIATANNSWMQAVSGALGGVGGALTSGLLSRKGK